MIIFRMNVHSKRCVVVMSRRVLVQLMFKCCSFRVICPIYDRNNVEIKVKLSYVSVKVKNTVVVIFHSYT